MTWAAVKIALKKTYAWCVQHWRWLVFGLVALIAYITGRKNARNLWVQAELARKQYKREAEEIEKIHADKNQKTKKAEKDFNEKVEKIEKIKDKDQKKLEAEKRRAMMRIVKDEELIDESLKNIGIDEV